MRPSLPAFFCTFVVGFAVTSFAHTAQASTSRDLWSGMEGAGMSKFEWDEGDFAMNAIGVMCERTAAKTECSMADNNKTSSKRGTVTGTKAQVMLKALQTLSLEKSDSMATTEFIRCTKSGESVSCVVAQKVK